MLQQTGVRGLMIGRGAIRNPWLFEQIRSHQRGEVVTLPTGREVLAYIADLYETVTTPGAPELVQVNKLKKYLNFLGLGVPDSEAFLHQIRRVTTRSAFFAVCAEFLDHGQPMPLAPVSPGGSPAA